MTLINRLKQLERRRRGRLPVITLKNEEPGQYRDGDGKSYNSAAVNELGKTHTVIVIKYGDWPNVGKTLATFGEVDLERV